MAAIGARRGLVLTVVVGFVATATAASAAAIASVTSDDVAAGASAIDRCDPDGFTAAPTLNGAEVESVVIGDIVAGCAGGELMVTLVDVAGDALGTAGPLVVPAAGFLSVPVIGTVLAADVAAYHVVVTGP